ncbi:CHAT domain-containing protein [Longimicrobium sp.]|uniref:CHAT domain-containing protein n=1 Tax=Longimicrobium sp. TaxID=2029185 RepID=UPI002BB03944|nr:CHAT domain-containing protein [Longimicrobium sp.]HSU17496.1 CHAT domain-containing protein [Longimicrobium sp.]
MKKSKVLFFAADPHSVGDGGTPRLQLDVEVREIRQRVSTASYRDDLDFDTRWAARPGDLLQALDETHPQVVHFSGHCGDAGLVLVGSEASHGHCVGASALAQLFQAYRGDIRVVVLNACLSLPQARAIAAVVGCAIGTRTEITDAAAITFSSSFYRTIAFGNSVQTAFDKARAALAVEHFEERECPQLVVRPGLDASKVFVVRPKRRRAGLAAAGLVGAVLVGVKLLHGGGGEPFSACAWAGAPHALMAPSGSSTAGPPGVQSDLDRAKLDYEAGRYAAAFPVFRRLAKSGNPEAMGFLGVMFLRGQGTRAYPDSGVHWLHEAAERDDARGMTELGSAYQNGDGVKRNRGWARHWLHKAADEKRWADAMRRLGAIYRDEQNYGTALTWFQNAVKAGSLDARIETGELYERGQGTPQDLEAAFCLYRTAAEAGSVRGMLIMGRTYRNGIGVPRSYDRAAGWYRKAAAAGSPEGMYALGELYLDGLGVPRDTAQADLWFGRAKNAGYRIAEGRVVPGAD